MAGDAHNPYQAPRTESVDPPPLPPRARPRNVNIALVLIGIAVLMPSLFFLRDLQIMGFNFDRSGVIPWVSELGLLAFTVFLCHQMMRGRSWPRVVLLCITLVMFIRLCWSVGQILRLMPELVPMLKSVRFFAVRVIPMGLTLAALHLLFYSSGSWFKR